jgi:hypothetical protein
VEPNIGDEGELVVINYEIALSSKTLVDAILDKKAKIFFDIRSAASFYRNILEISTLKGTFTLEPGKAIGKLQIFPLICATEDLENFKFDNVNPEYGTNPKFNIPAGSLLGFDEQITFDLKLKQDAKKGFFIVNTDPEMNPNSYMIHTSASSISITMGKNARAVFEAQRSSSELKKYLATSIYKDAISQAIEEITNGKASEDSDWAQNFSQIIAKTEGAIPVGATMSEINQMALRVLAENGFGYSRIYKELHNG